MTFLLPPGIKGLKDISFKVFVSLVWLANNHMFGSGDFGDKTPSWFLKSLKLPSFYSGCFNIFENAVGQFISNRPLVLNLRYFSNWKVKIQNIPLVFGIQLTILGKNRQAFVNEVNNFLGNSAGFFFEFYLVDY